MNYLAAAAALALFAWRLRRTQAVKAATAALALAGGAMAMLRDPALSDGDKERAARASALRLFGDAAMMLGGLLLAAVPAAAILAILAAARLVTLGAVAAAASSWPFLIVSTPVIAVLLFWRR
jgi:hypothetical protein